MPTDYHEIKRRYLQALELPPADRQQYLDMLDPAVKSEVSKLLSAEETASESFLAPVAGNLQQKLKSPGNEFDSWIGRTIAGGRYRIEKLIGQGGRGSVLKATDTHLSTRLTGTGVIGTPGYIAPEILLGQEQDGRLDQYSLAITVFVLVAGRPVFAGSTAMSILARQINEPAPDLHDVRPTLPRVFTDVVMRGLEREPEDRFSDSRAFAEALEESLHVFVPVVKKSVHPPLLGSAKPPPITQSEHPADAPASTAAYPVFNEPPFVEPIDEEPVVGELIDDEPIFGEPIDDSANA